jgi:hypothetical protein
MQYAYMLWIPLHFVGHDSIAFEAILTLSLHEVFEGLHLALTWTRRGYEKAYDFDKNVQKLTYERSLTNSNVELAI